METSLFNVFSFLLVTRVKGSMHLNPDGYILFFSIKNTFGTLFQVSDISNFASWSVVCWLLLSWFFAVVLLFVILAFCHKETRQLACLVVVLNSLRGCGIVHPYETLTEVHFTVGEGAAELILCSNIKMCGKFSSLSGFCPSIPKQSWKGVKKDDFIS